MKHLFLALSLLVAITANAQFLNSEYCAPHIVEEGRTWWYHGYRMSGRLPHEDYEYGIRIGAKAEIDGVEWHSIDLVFWADKEYDATEWNYSEPDKHLSYIREDGDAVYVLFEPESLREYENIGFSTMDLSSWNCFMEGENIREVKIYGFGPATEMIQLGNDEHVFTCKIEEVTEMESHGYRYTVFTASSTDMPCANFGEPWYYADKIGVLAENEWMGSQGLFFAPLGSELASIGTQRRGTLRYVTEGDDNEIIYEGTGGTKAWAGELGVKDLEMTATPGATRWFNMQGVEIPVPEAAGIYVKVSAGGAEKVVVQ
ncbi:MAG: hypothetical protein NC405_07095 [Odoribacter sp.]|nr:hypothetical protein [Odoribacter sp.]